jgi:hypothetical protein
MQFRKNDFVFIIRSSIHPTNPWIYDPKEAHGRETDEDRVCVCTHTSVCVLPGWMCTVPLWNRKLFISRSCAILVLTTVLGRPRRADVENGVKTIHDQGPTTSRENAIRKYLNFPQTFFFKSLVWLWPKFVSVLEPIHVLTSNVGLRISNTRQAHISDCTFVCGTLFGRIKLN